MKKRFIFVVVLSLCLLMFSSVVSAANIVLVNQTGVTIHELNVSISSRNNWGDDLLGNEQMPNNTQITITLDATAGKWDIQALNPKGDSIYWTDLDLRGVSKIVLDASGTANLL